MIETEDGRAELTSQDASLASGAAASGPDTNPSRFQALVLFLVVSVGRCAFSMDRTVFDIAPDEPANLAMSRWLSGRGHWNMFENATYRPGLATLLAPLFWVTDSQPVIFRFGLLFAALCGGASAVLLAWLARRLTDLSRTAALVSAGAIALLPASLSASAHLWAEPLVTLLFLGTLSLLVMFFDRPGLKLGLATVVLSAGSYATHGRMLPLFATVVCAVGGVFAVNRRWQLAGVITLTSVALAWATEWYVNLFYARLWTNPAEFNTFRTVARRLGDPIEIARSGLGQLWYLLASSLGVFGIGVAFAVFGAIGGSDRRRARDLRLVIATTLPLFALSAVFMSNRDRVDQLIYGRYNDAVVWPLLVVGIASVAALPASRWGDLPKRVRLTIAGVVVTLLEGGMVLEMTLRDRSRQQLEILDMIPGLAPVLGSVDRLPVVWITLGSATLFGLLIVVALHTDDRTRVVIASVGLLALPVAGFAAHGAIGLVLDLGEKSRVVQDIEGRELPIGVDVVYGHVPEALDPGVGSYLQRYYGQLYQWYLPDHRFRLTNSGDYGPGSYVLAPIHDRVLETSGACVLWRDPAVAMALWFSSPDCPERGPTD